MLPPRGAWVTMANTLYAVHYTSLMPQSRHDCPAGNVRGGTGGRGDGGTGGTGGTGGDGGGRGGDGGGGGRRMTGVVVEQMTYSTTERAGCVGSCPPNSLQGELIVEKGR